MEKNGKIQFLDKKFHFSDGLYPGELFSFEKKCNNIKGITIIKNKQIYKKNS